MSMPREELDRELELIDDLAEAYETGGDGPIGHAPIPRDNADRIVELASAMDDTTVRHQYVNANGIAQTFEPNTARIYVSNLRRVAQQGVDLTATDVDEINDYATDLHDERGLSLSTVTTYQSAFSAFFRYHADLGIDPNDVDVFVPDSTPRHDERDVFTDADLAAMRDACREPRDRAMLELLVFTGQRINAIRTLRVGDMHPETGVFYLNEDADGLKGADSRGLKRPLFGSRKYVRDWIGYHPFGDDPDAWLFIGNPSNPESDPTKPWSWGAIRKRLVQVADRADVDKPVNPHAFRHYFVTTMRRDYGLDSDTLRALLGVAVDSNILETTYSHVTNDEYVEKAEVAVGYRDEPDDLTKPLTPDACPTCGELLESHWYRCPACGELFDADLKAFEAGAKNARDRVIDTAMDPETPLTDDERVAVRALIARLDDPVSLLDG